MFSHTITFFESASSMPCEEINVTVDNASLYCRVIGKGDPIIVVHGGPGLSMDYLLPSLERLAKNNMLIFYDQRGNGKSTGIINDESMNLDKFVMDLQAIQNHLNLRTVGLMGHSWGAYLAMAYAAKFPERVDKLLLLNSIPIFFTHTTEDPYEAMIESIIQSDAYKKNNSAGMIKSYKDLFQFFFYDPQLVNQLNLDTMSARQVQNSALIHKIFENNFFHQPHDLRSKLVAIESIPTLIIHGDGHDIPAAVAQEIHALIKNSTLVILNSGHFPFIEKPNEFFESVTKFNHANPVKTVTPRTLMP